MIFSKKHDYYKLTESLQFTGNTVHGRDKYVSSTARYRTDNLEDLQKELEKYHPFK